MNEQLNAFYDIEYLGEGSYRLDKHHFFKGANEEESIDISLMKELQHSAIPEMDSYVDAALPTSSNYDEIFVFGMHFETIEDIEAFKILIKAIKWKMGVEFVYTKAATAAAKRFWEIPTNWRTFRTTGISLPMTRIRSCLRPITSKTFPILR